MHNSLGDDPYIDDDDEPNIDDDDEDPNMGEENV